jgi:phage terminase large subunit
MAAQGRVSITDNIKEYLNSAQSVKVTAELIGREPLSNVYEAAAAKGMTLASYVAMDPVKALREAEACYNDWNRVLATAALSGVIETDSGPTEVNKNITDLLKDKIKYAEKEIKRVEMLSMSAVADGSARSDQVVATLYNLATKQGNMKALQYLIDRVDGRPGEARADEVSFDGAQHVYYILHSLFDKQLEVLHTGPGTKIVCAGRQSGKTRVCAALILIECLRKPYTNCLYIGTSMKLAEGLLYSALNELIDECGLKTATGKRLNFKKFENGSKILVRGLSNMRDPDMIRGYKAKVIVIDEFFHLAAADMLEYMMNDVLTPMQLPYANEAQMLLIGTPPHVRGTFGEKMWQESDIPHFSWNFEQNPFPEGQDKRKYIEKKLKEKGLDWGSPYARREYLAEFAYDEDALLYPVYHTFDPDVFQPQIHVTHIFCGMDYGVTAYNGIIGVAWDSIAKQGFVFFESKFNRWQNKAQSMYDILKSEVKNLWRMALDMFPGVPPEEANKKIWWEADSSDQIIAEDLMHNVGIPELPGKKLEIRAAHKLDKVIMHDKLRDLLRSGRLLLPQNSEVVSECEKTVLFRDEMGNIWPEIDDKFFHPDLLDALRYAMWNALGDEVMADRQYGAEAIGMEGVTTHKPKPPNTAVPLPKWDDDIPVKGGSPEDEAYKGKKGKKK